jgi:hypothetical protein
MKRRSFFRFAALSGFGLVSGRGTAEENVQNRGDSDDYVDPYFLDDGNLSSEELESVESYVGYQERSMTDPDAIQPRGGRPQRGPNYRFLHWPGPLGDRSTHLIGALSLTPEITEDGPYLFNAQILGFNTSTADWRSKAGGGSLSIEFRAQFMDESMTWLYLESFETQKGGGNTVGYEYVAQRDNAPDPVVCEDAKLDMRITLVRHRKSPGVLRKILRIGSLLTGSPVVNMGSKPSSFDYLADRPAVMAVPQMVQEGVAFTQATLGAMSDESPIWRSGFTSYAIAYGGGRLSLRPGLWVAMDDSRDIDYEDIVLVDLGGRVGIKRGDAPLDVNYLVLGVEINGSVGERGVLPKGVVPKGVAPKESTG